MNPSGYFLSRLQFECNTTMILLLVQVLLLLFHCSSEYTTECPGPKNMFLLYLVKMIPMILTVSSSGVQLSTTQSSSATFNTRNASVIGRGANHTSPVNSGFWVSIELFISLSQIIAAITVLSLSRNEKPETPLFTWVVGYTSGCIITVPHLYWRYYTQFDNQDIEQELAHQQLDSSNNHSETTYTAISADQITEAEHSHDSGSGSQRNRVNSLVNHTKMALDCFFVAWSVVGNVWIFGGHSSSSDAPNLYRLCTVLLTFSYIGYAMPFILCATICFCLPCIIYITGISEDLNHRRGSPPEFISTLPTYKFKAKQIHKRQGSEISSDDHGDGGILAYGSDMGQVISAEDALCCICLSEYVDDNIIKELPCAHFFHMKCVDKWLKIDSFCPLCKSDVWESTCSGIRFG